MKIKKSLLVAGAATTIGLAGLTGVNAASAATDTSGESLVTKIAQKFSLNEADVQAVFDEEHEAREAEMQAMQSKHLQALVDDGTITAEQKTLIEEKTAELKSTMETEREALDAWAEEQGIEAHDLMIGGPRHEDGNDRLQQLVDDGKITAEQKTAIEAKQAELQEQREASQEALEQWAEDNDIDPRYLMKAGMRVGPGGHGGFGPEKVLHRL